MLSPYPQEGSSNRRAQPGAVTPRCDPTAKKRATDSMLTLSTKTRYATRMLVFLAGKAQAGRCVSSRQIGETEEVSPDYVEQILAKLRSAGIVRSRRGPKGGFVLARDPGAITVADVLQAMEGPLFIITCLAEDCPRSPRCVTQPLWRKANEALLNQK